MPKTHITLVGGQTFPVYAGIIDSNPDKVIFICSEQSKEETERIKNELSIPSYMYVLNPVNLIKINKKVDAILSTLQEEELTINITGGTKVWSIIFYNILHKHPKCTVLYIDQNNRVWNFKDNSMHWVEFNMDTQFRLQGNPLKEYKEFSDFTKEDDLAVKDIETLRIYNINDFNYLTNQFEKFSHLTSVQCPKSQSYLYYDAATKTFNIALEKRYKGLMEKELKSPNIRSLLLNTGWFEYKMAAILSQWEKSVDLRMNCLFPAINNASKNEVDIIVNTGLKVLFVECKTQLYKITDIDKFNSVVRNYGGMGSKALFITHEQMSATAIEKCKEYNILHFSIKNHLETVNEDLFNLLDKELFNINTK